MNTNSYTRRFELRVNGNILTKYLNQVYTTSGTVHQPVALAASIHLRTGDKVGVYASNGVLHEDTLNGLVTQFSCFFLAEN